RGLDVGVVAAPGRRADRQFGRPEGIENVPTDRQTRLRAEPADVTGRVVSREGGQVDAGNGSQQPRDLPLLLDRAPGSERRGPPLDSTAVRTRRSDPVQIERDPRIARLLRP